MDALVRASLVERIEIENIEHFSTYPFITAYAESLLTDDDSRLFAIRVCEHFSGVSGLISQMIGTDHASTAYLLLELEEGNLWACLDTKRPYRASHCPCDSYPDTGFAWRRGRFVIYGAGENRAVSLIRPHN